jgi:2-iminobutanoate/2-iminopropanoate deaminase
LNRETGKFETADFEHQVRLTLQNVESVLTAAGCRLNDVVKVNVHLQNINDFDRLNAIYQQFFEPPQPARTTVQSVLVAGISVEIDAIAVRGCSGSEGMSK